eukprot:TRINITY_DN44320_c0_g1_i1.p1 TRINITY_DN44320_c0_g1~~TRINITY_DN44320_c0_g1_i1.p1  ORF type:complete len:180 (+),score=53.61 TRINITY_DN44320_c0_g1_i1:39-542(+)
MAKKKGSKKEAGEKSKENDKKKKEEKEKKEEEKSEEKKEEVKADNDGKGGEDAKDPSAEVQERIEEEASDADDCCICPCCFCCWCTCRKKKKRRRREAESAFIRRRLGSLYSGKGVDAWSTVNIKRDIYFEEYERLKANQVAKNIAVADFWNNSRTPSQTSLETMKT